MVRAVFFCTVFTAHLATAFLATAWVPPAWAETLPTVAEAIAEKGTALEHRPGLLDLYVDERAGTVWLALPSPGEEGEVGRFLYVEGLVQGLGSNPVGLDRGQMGEARLVVLRRLGGRLLVEELSPKYRALSNDVAERAAVAESFATSVLWAGAVLAEDVLAEDVLAQTGGGPFLVDFTSFVVRDAHGTVAKLRETEQGGYSVDGERSVLDPAACLAFPENLELEALLTFALEPGATVADHVKATAPSGHSVTLVQHQSLIRLPPPGFRPREFHPESGFFEQLVVDYAAPLDAPLEKRWIARHRLEKVHPREARSPVVQPIVFYLDPGTPEPVRSALLDGAGWWADGFAAAGFEDAFRVEMLPAGAHPLDVRYNVIQWVHRSTRGWSYGGGVIDPRTGEIVRGQVTLGSLRVRQDRLIFEGLLGVAQTGSGAPDDPVQLSLARLRQLAAHEVGHALGLAHNFAASTWGRASVMDYPAPLVRVVAPAAEDGKGASLDVSQAYAVGVGPWDVQALRYGYGQFPVDEEREALAQILRQGREEGMVFLSDETARPAGAAQPLANLWDNSFGENGADPVVSLRETLAVRRVALESFGEGNIAPGRPLALLQEVLAPVYLYHRYQVDAAAKMLGGIDYRYAHRDDGREMGRDRARPIPAEDQRQALGALLGILEPEVLDLPDRILDLLLPRPFGYRPHRELFQGHGAPAFDPLAAAGTAADQVVAALLQPQRAARMVDQHRRDPSLPSFEEVVQALTEAVFSDPAAEEGPRWEELRRTVQAVVVHGMIATAADPQTSTAVRSRLEGALVRLWDSLQNRQPTVQGDHRATLAGDIDRYLERSAPAMPTPKAAPDQPPGSPIGMGRAMGLGACSVQP